MKSFLIFTCLLTNCLNANAQVFDAIYNTFQTKCISCHSNAGRSGNLDLEGTGATITDKQLVVFNNLVALI